jgi:hypothetical protein
MKVSRDTVYRWVKKNGSLIDAYRSGRPPAMKKKTIRQLVSYVKRTPFTSSPRLKKRFALKCDKKTILRVLNRNGLVVRIPRQNIAFKEEHQKKRIAFAQGYANFDWSKVIWSDEKCFYVNESKHAWVVRPKGINNAYSKRYMVARVKHPQKLNVFACFSSKGLGNLSIFRENMDAKILKDILTTNLLPSAQRMFGGDLSWRFQHDNDPKFKSKLVQKWVHDNGIQCLDFPPCSPDLNPIENLWSDFNRRVQLRHPRTLDQLERILVDEWPKTRETLLQNLVNSLPNRCAAVIAAQGNTTAY